MEFVEILKILRAHRLALAAVTVLAIAGALLVGFNVQLSPPGLSSKTTSSGTATTQILVDSPVSAIADLKQDTAPLVTRATVFAQFMASSVVRDRIAKATDIPVDAITAEGPFSGPGETENTVTPSEARGSQRLAEGDRYRLTFVAQKDLPIVTVYAKAATAGEAARLANGVYDGVDQYLQDLRTRYDTKPAREVTIRQLGRAEGATVHSGGSKIVLLLTFSVIFLLGCLGIVGLDRLRHPERGADADAFAATDQDVHPLDWAEGTPEGSPGVRGAG